MKINKIRPKFHFLTKIETKMTFLVFLFYFTSCLFASRAIWKPFCRRLQLIWSCTNSKKIVSTAQNSNS